MDDISHSDNAYVKFVMCWLQASGNIKHLTEQLPLDVQALVLLHNGDHEANFTGKPHCGFFSHFTLQHSHNSRKIAVVASDLLPFTHLQTLEIRGSNSTRPNVHFVMDEPLTTVQHVNFEAIELLGDEQMKRRMSLGQHPSETYDYVPESERVTYNVTIDVTDEDEVEIVSYDVYRLELQKFREPTFHGWTNLLVLRIHGCQLDQVNWEMFDGLAALQHLSLEHNGIKIVPPFAFYGALHIRSLSLAHNDILDLNYRALAGLLELQTLDLSHNNLTKLSELSFPPFPQLRTVDLRHNPVRYIFPMTFGVMNATRRMTIGSDAMALDLTVGRSFGALDQLETLQLRNVYMPTLTDAVFKGLQNVRTLHMSGHIKRIDFDAFAEMPALRELVLSHCGIVDISMDAFYGVRYLEIVDLSHNQLSTVPAGIFDEQRLLKEIYLNNNLLTMLPKRFFDNLSIKMVRLIENPWVCTCEMRAWRQAITNRVRGKRLPARGDCVMHAGRQLCGDSVAVQYAYEFDNKMSPRCDGGPSEFRHRSVYYTMRHNIRCLETTAAPSATVNVEKQLATHFYSGNSTISRKRMEKMRIKHKYEVTVDAEGARATMAGVAMQFPQPAVQHGNQKASQKNAFRNQLREAFRRDALRNKLKQSETSNNIAI